jgi:hypothetical protein
MDTLSGRIRRPIGRKRLKFLPARSSRHSMPKSWSFRTVWLSFAPCKSFDFCIGPVGSVPWPSKNINKLRLSVVRHAARGDGLEENFLLCAIPVFRFAPSEKFVLSLLVILALLTRCGIRDRSERA